jgi:hypothetical protein
MAVSYYQQAANLARESADTARHATVNYGVADSYGYQSSGQMAATRDLSNHSENLESAAQGYSNTYGGSGSRGGDTKYIDTDA